MRPALKQRLRTGCLDLRKKLTPSFLDGAAHRLILNLAGLLGRTRFHGLCLYNSILNEPDVGPLARSFPGVPTFYPRVEGRALRFIRTGPGTRFRRSAFGIGEPAAGRRGFVANGLDGPNRVLAVLVPGIVFDRLGGRIGFGKGYYDTFLAGAISGGGPRLIAIGVAWEFQIKRTPLPLGPRDIRMDVIVTEKRVIECRSGEEAGMERPAAEKT